MFVMNIPIYVGYESGTIDDLRKRMDLIKKQSKILKDSLEYEVISTIKIIVSVLPSCLALDDHFGYKRDVYLFTSKNLRMDNKHMQMYSNF